MPIFYIGMPQAEELRLPSLFLVDEISFYC